MNDAMDEILSFLCELYAERDYYSRGGLIDAFRDKIQQYNVSHKNIPNRKSE